MAEKTLLRQTVGFRTPAAELVCTRLMMNMNMNMKLNTTRTRALSLRSLRSARNVSRVGSRAWTHAVDPSKTAVVLIEYQNEFTTEGGKLHEAVKGVMESSGMLNNTKEVSPS